MGFQPQSIVNYLALLGWNSKLAQRKKEVQSFEVFSIDDLTENFSLEGIKRDPVVVDEAKLQWLNRYYFKEKLNCPKVLPLELKNEVCSLYK